MRSQCVIAFDFGINSIGSAIGQSLTQTASPLQAFKAKDGIPNWQEIEGKIKQWQPDILVVGLPLDMDGQALEGITNRAKKFADRLYRRFQLPIELQDERLSTKSARDLLFERGGYKALQKGRVDNESAVIILESWFQSLQQ